MLDQRQQDEQSVCKSYNADGQAMYVMSTTHDDQRGCDAVVLWLVRNMKTKTDFNSFLMSKFFVLGQPDLVRLLGKCGAAQTMARVDALHHWQQDTDRQNFAETKMRFLSSGSLGSASTTFAVQGMAQALYYMHYFAQGQLPEQYDHCCKVLHKYLMPHLHEFISCSVRCWDTETSLVPEAEKLSIALAVVNTFTLFLRSIGMVQAHDLQEVLALFRQLYIVQDSGELGIHGKAAVLSHILLNVRGQCEFADVDWIFVWLESVQPELLCAFEDTNNPSRDIVLDLVAEILTGYRYFNCWSPSRERYETFVAGEIRRKYADRFDWVYRYYAHADFPSDHEALSLYHMMISSYT